MKKGDDLALRCRGRGFFRPPADCNGCRPAETTCFCCEEDDEEKEELFSELRNIISIFSRYLDFFLFSNDKINV